MERYTFRGSPHEAGKAQGELDPAYAREELKARMEQSHDFDHPYFRKNIVFMEREFPGFVEEMGAFGEAAGLEGLDQTYYLHIYSTGREADGCSALGLTLEDDGPAMLTTNDACHADRAEEVSGSAILKTLPDLKPHGVLGVGRRCNVTVFRAVNDAGLLLGGASGHPKYNWPDNPETVNLYFTMRLIAQHCGDCDDVRHFARQYRISGVKGTNGVAVDAGGNMLGFELESENIAFREPEDGMVLEVNHWQHPDLQVPARAGRPEFWQSPYYYNSQNRIHYLDYYREQFRQVKKIQDLVDFAFDVHSPGSILQSDGHNIADWVTCQAFFMTARDRMMRVHAHPVTKGDYDEARYPG